MVSTYYPFTDHAAHGGVALQGPPNPLKHRMVRSTFQKDRPKTS